VTRQGSARSMTLLEKECEELAGDPSPGVDAAVRIISSRPMIPGISEKGPTESRGDSESVRRDMVVVVDGLR
jgi:hypothetical protein